ncbi:MAG TPA: PAS domain S-box protein [Mucilaginibacter sp.]|nr:PAS domain S-box protein [Mucilaginibacter sp.]
MSLKENEQISVPPFLSGGGEMGNLIRSIDWSATQLGDPNNWPAALKYSVSMMLATNFPVLICWGDDYIQLYNDAFRPILGETKHPQAMGLSTSKTFAEIWHTIKPLFIRVSNGDTVSYPDFIVPLNRNGYFEDCYFDFSYSPIRDEAGTILGVLVICMETTEKVRAMNQAKLNHENIRNMVRQAPVGMCILKDDPLQIEEVNDAFLEIIGKTKEEIKVTPDWIINAKAAEIYEPVVAEVIKTGQSYHVKEREITLLRSGKQHIVHFDFVYEPMHDFNGKVDGIMVVAIDVSDKATFKQEQQLVNEEITAANEELVSTNEELAEMQVSLQKLVQALTESEVNFRNMILQSPVAMGLFSGEDMVLEIINDKFLELWGKDSSVIGKPVEEALPEMKGQPYPQIMRDVFNTGTTYLGNEAKVFLYRRGRMEEGYYNFINQAFRNGEGKITGLIVVANEVTEQVKARNEMERVLTQVRLSKEAAELGLFDSNIKTGTLEWDARCRTLFGISHQNPVTYDDFTNGLHPHDRKRIQKAVDDAYNKELTNGAYDVEYRTIGVEDKKTRWVRAKGQVYFDENDKPVRFIGSVLDITDNKAHEEAMRRVNDDLAWANKELIEAQVQLKDIINELKESETKYRDLVQHAPVGIAVYRGREAIVESVNDGMLEIWGKPATVTGLQLTKALPELEGEGQPFLKLIDDVFTSGESYYGYEARALLNHDGELKEGFFDFIFQPLKDDGGVTHSVLQVATDVTQRVVSRMEKFKAEEMMRFSVEAANAATWYMDAETREFVVSDRLREIYGLHPESEVSYDDILNQIPPEYHEKVNMGIAEAVSEGKGYSLEHPLVTENGKKRWVRALGKMYQAVGNRKAHFSGLAIDITEQKQDELRKNDFIGMVSHELKTPLTSLTAIIQLLDIKLKGNPDPFVAGAAANANKQAKRMTSMINGFLNLSRLESGKLHIIKEKFDIEDLIQEVIEETELIVASHSIHFTPNQPVIVNADRDKIGSVISNLLSNAVKYSPKGKDIEVQCAIAGKNVQVSVKDEGMGIKEQDRGKLFERYYRVQSNHTQHISGFGIGLYLCSEIIQRHEGEIWAESQSGVGSTFYFAIPRVL